MFTEARCGRRPPAIDKLRSPTLIHSPACLSDVARLRYIPVRVAIRPPARPSVRALISSFDPALPSRNVLSGRPYSRVAVRPLR